MMKITIVLLLPLILFAQSPFESPEPHQFDLSMFNTADKVQTKEKTIKVVCRFVCDKKLSKEQKIEEALSFYKKRD